MSKQPTGGEQTYVLAQSMTEKRRKTTNLTIDGRILEIIKGIAKGRDLSVSRYIEEHFYHEFRKAGIIPPPPDFEPLGERRGGDRSKEKD